MNRLMRARVVLADDHRLVAEGLKSLLSSDFDLLDVVEDGRALVAAAKKLRPDVIVADISMPHLNGLDALVQLKKSDPEVKVVFLTMHQEPGYARRALEAGASGYVLKHSAPAELVAAIRAAVAGGTYISPSLASQVFESIQHGGEETDAPTDRLTSRQREILQLLAEGQSAKEVASNLQISARTVEFHKYQMMEALNLHNSAELIHFAFKHGIVSI